MSEDTSQLLNDLRVDSAVISNDRTQTKERRNYDVTTIHVIGPLSLHWAQ